MLNSLRAFDSFFSPPTIVVVSEERLKAAELKAKEDQLESIEERIQSFSKYRDSLKEEIQRLKEPQSLEEALTGDA